MQSRTLCWPLQIVQYLSHEQSPSGLSHCTQRIWAGMKPSEETLPDDGREQQGGFSSGTARFALRRGLQMARTSRSLTPLGAHASMNFCPS